MSLRCWPSSHGRPLLLRPLWLLSPSSCSRIENKIFLMLISAYNQYFCTQKKGGASSINITVNMELFLVFSSHRHVFFCCCFLTSNPSSPQHLSISLTCFPLSITLCAPPHLCPAGSHCVVSHLACWNVSVMWGPAACEDVVTVAPETDWQAKRERR